MFSLNETLSRFPGHALKQTFGQANKKVPFCPIFAAFLLNLLNGPFSEKFPFEIQLHHGGCFDDGEWRIYELITLN